MAQKLFGTDGIRGVANTAITPDLAMKVAQATGIMFQRGEYRHRAVIGKDTRLSGYMIENALVAGFTSAGIDVLVARADADPCRCYAHPLDAGGCRRHDFGLA